MLYHRKVSNSKVKPVSYKKSFDQEWLLFISFFFVISERKAKVLRSSITNLILLTHHDFRRTSFTKPNEIRSLSYY